MSIALNNSHKPTNKRKSDNQDSGRPLPDIETKLSFERISISQNVMDFNFNKKRVKMISPEIELPEACDGIIYWMSRDQRVQDNWAFLFAQRLALKHKLPLHVVFCLVPKFLDATYRHYHFMMEGLQFVEKECQELAIPFHLLFGYAKDVLPSFIKKYNLGGVVTDFAPLRLPQQWTLDVLEKLSPKIPLGQVDAHNIVPCWLASEKQEYGARTIRKKIHDKLPEFLTGFPPVVQHIYPYNKKFKSVNWKLAYDSLEVNNSVGPVDGFTPGTKAGLEALQQFCEERLKLFGSKRNDPTIDALSNLSPWIHFGQISAQRCVLEVQKYKKKYTESVDAYIEEAVIRRELADNYCFYQKNYDNIDGAYEWAKNTLKLHKKDKRAYIYTKETLERSETHDDLWNSAQIQMVKEGKMHGFLRMYWAKKILEWTPSPEEALSITIYLNDKYSLDGRDPNGYVGCMWSLCGIHDQGWGERDVFGKIRYMNYAGCKRKFDVKAFVARYGGKEFGVSTEKPIKPPKNKKPKK